MAVSLGGLGAEIKGAEKLPALPAFPASWTHKKKGASSPRSRSQSPSARASSKERKNSKAEAEPEEGLASESEKMRLRTLLVAHPEVSDNMKSLPSLPKNMTTEQLEQKKLQFATELGNEVPKEVVLFLLGMLGQFLDMVILTIKHLVVDVKAEYQSDEPMIQQCKTLLALYLGEYLNTYTLLFFRLFIKHPSAAISKGVPPAATAQAAAAPPRVGGGPRAPLPPPAEGTAPLKSVRIECPPTHPHAFEAAK
jgi:hypothetical protein